MKYNSPHKLTWKPCDNAGHPDIGKYPNGMNIDVSYGMQPACTFQLPYPAPSVGFWSVYCKTCRHQNNIAANGRPDDVRSYKVNCRNVSKEEARQLQFELAI